MIDKDTVARLRDTGRSGMAALTDAYRADPEPRGFLRERAKQVDALLIELWLCSGLKSAAAIIAVGGYGRGEMYPCSDVDLLILMPPEATQDTTDKVEKLVALFWDIGLEVGHSVRTAAECLSEATGDLTIQTTLMEARFLSGNEKLFKSFQASFRAAMKPAAFYEAKRLEQNERYQRYQETPYSLEPNCKESPGGLRDLQMILWIAKAAGLGERWAGLEAHGLVTPSEVRQLRNCERVLQHFRISLHLQTGRREDRLLFDVQTQLAEGMGHTASIARRASEVMMQAYYQNAKLVTQLNTILLQNIGALILPPSKDPPLVINERFRRVGNLLDMANENLFRENPDAMLECFLLMQQDAQLKGMTARTLRALWRGRVLIDDAFRARPKNRQTFLALFQGTRGVVHEFRRMNQYSVLGRYLPNFGKIVGQMQHDLFHVYTVDQHILMVMRNLRRFTMDEYAHEHPLESQLISAFPRHWLLYIAALFHDIAKGRGGDHSQLGMADAETFCKQHGISPEDTRMIVWLVREHLTMSRIAQKSDISDPRVVDDFANQMVDERHLTALYLLTVADIRGTSPKVWNAWRGQLLATLFRSARKALRQGGDTPEPQGIIEERQQEAIKRLRYFALGDSVQEHLWQELDTAYFLRHTGEEIAWHARCLHYRILGQSPVVKARINREFGVEGALSPSAGIQVLVYAFNDEDLFLRLVGFFARAGFSIVDARINTTRHGYALDSFVLLDVLNRGNNRELVSYVEHELGNHLSGDSVTETPGLGRLSRQVRHFPIAPEISIRPDERGGQYLLSITAVDRPGLLFAIAEILASHHVSVHAAKIATLGERVEDNFLVSGASLTASSERLRLERELLEKLKV